MVTQLQSSSSSWWTGTKAETQKGTKGQVTFRGTSSATYFLQVLPAPPPLPPSRISQNRADQGSTYAPIGDIPFLNHNRVMSNPWYTNEQPDPQTKALHEFLKVDKESHCKNSRTLITAKLSCTKYCFCFHKSQRRFQKKLNPLVHTQPNGYRANISTSTIDQTVSLQGIQRRDG